MTRQATKRVVINGVEYSHDVDLSSLRSIPRSERKWFAWLEYQPSAGWVFVYGFYHKAKDCAYALDSHIWKIGDYK